MKKTILALFALLCINAVSAQKKDVKIKDDKVLVDDAQILKYEKINIDEHSFYSLNDDELINYQYKNNGTDQYYDDDYFIINFINEKIKVESVNRDRVTSGLGMNSRKNMEKMIEWLLKEKVLNADGTINAEKLETFSQKYNENVTDRTVRN